MDLKHFFNEELEKYNINGIEIQQGMLVVITVKDNIESAKVISNLLSDLSFLSKDKKITIITPFRNQILNALQGIDENEFRINILHTANLIIDNFVKASSHIIVIDYLDFYIDDEISLRQTLRGLKEAAFKRPIIAIVNRRNFEILYDMADSIINFNDENI